MSYVDMAAFSRVAPRGEVGGSGAAEGIREASLPFLFGAA